MKKYANPKDKPNYHDEVSYENVEVPSDDRVIAGDSHEFLSNVSELIKSGDVTKDLIKKIKTLIIRNPKPDFIYKTGSGNIWELLRVYHGKAIKKLTRGNSDFEICVCSFAVYKGVLEDFKNRNNRRSKKDKGLRLTYEVFVDITKTRKSPFVFFTNLNYHEYRESGYSESL